MSNDRLCPYCLRWHHPVDYCQPEAVVPRWHGVGPEYQARADRAEADLIRAYRAARRKSAG